MGVSPPPSVVEQHWGAAVLCGCYCNPGGSHGIHASSPQTRRVLACETICTHWLDACAVAHAVLPTSLRIAACVFAPLSAHYHAQHPRGGGKLGRIMRGWCVPVVCSRGKLPHTNLTLSFFAGPPLRLSSPTLLSSDLRPR